VDHVTLIKTYDFNRDEANMILLAAAKLKVEVLALGDWMLSHCILNNWDTADWSVENICTQYRYAHKLAEYAI
jgi:hypothetical protein